eukprot:287468_1
MITLVFIISAINAVNGSSLCKGLSRLCGGGKGDTDLTQDFSGGSDATQTLIPHGELFRMIPSAPTEPILPFLTTLNMMKYYDQFISHGIHDIQDANLPELIAMYIPPEDMQTIMEARSQELLIKLQ